MDFDNVLEFIGDFGLFQLWVYFLNGFVALIVGAHMLANVFVMASPPARCYVDGCDTDNSTIKEPWLNYTVSGFCQAFSQNNNTCMGDLVGGTLGGTTCDPECFSNITSPCSRFIYDKSDFQITTVTEWNLVCDNEWKVSTSQSIFMGGTLIGAFIFGAIGDKWGRRSVFKIAPILFFISALSTYFINDWILYTTLKMISASAMTGIYATSFVVVVEFIGVSKRAWCGNIFQIIFACGELLLAFLAYFLRDWRHLQLAITLPVIFFIIYPWLVPESVRWQLSNSNFADATETIHKAAKLNKKILPENMIDDLLEDASNKQNSNESSFGFIHILKSPILLRRSLNIFFNWTVNSLVYYGLSLSASNLGGSVYFNFVALAFVEIPAIIIATAVQQRLGRRLVLCVVMILGGLSCIGSIFIPENVAWIATVMAVFGKSNIAASFAVIYIYSAEIFPTSLRTTGIGVSSMCSRIGGILAPLVANLGRFHYSLPMYIFGGSSIIAGLFALILPETHNKKLPETIKEAERFGRRFSNESEVPLIGG